MKRVFTLSEAKKILAGKAGSAKTQKKADAARRNGKLGGRPKKEQSK